MRAERREIPGYPRYHITSSGEVYGFYDRLLSACVNKYGYKTVVLYRDTVPLRFTVHKLVLLTWVGPAPSFDSVCRHLDGDKLNNDYTNLVWGTVQENVNDRMKHGTSGNLKGEAHPNAKLTQKDVDIIRVSPETYAVIAAKFGVSHQTISNICLNQTWKGGK